MSVILIRHAESLFNRAATLAGYSEELLFDKQYIDAYLSESGIEQALEASQKIKDMNIKYVISSPLRRCLQTSLTIFQNHPSSPKFIAYPLIREYPSAVCDIPENINTVMKEFKEFCFSTHFNQDKELWWAQTLENEKVKQKMISDLKEKNRNPEEIAENVKHYIHGQMKKQYTYFETRFDARKRALKAIEFFKEQIKKLNPGEQIAIVAHFAILRQITGKNFSPTDGTSLDGRKFENCEIFEFKLS